eukprot:Gb_04598 [translate_table: standard]
MEAVLLVTDSIILPASVVTWAIQTFRDKADGGKHLSVVTQAELLEGKFQFKSSSLDVVVFVSENSEFNTQEWVGELARVVKPGGVVFLQIDVPKDGGVTEIHASLERNLLLAGFVAPEAASPVECADKSDGIQSLALKARKPSWETGSSFSLKKKAVVKAESLPKPDVMGIKLQINDDLEDLIDEDSLLSEEDLKKPILPTVGDCEIGSSRKACKNCTCGRAEMEEKQEKLELTAGQLNNPQSACGSCGLGDAFRCNSCPYKGLPPFKLGEKVTLTDTLLTADV